METKIYTLDQIDEAAAALKKGPAGGFSNGNSLRFGGGCNQR